MDPSLFHEHVEVKRTSYSIKWDEYGKEIESSITKHYNIDSVPLYEVYRLEDGLVHPAYVIEVQKRKDTKKKEVSTSRYSVIRFFQGNSYSKPDETYFDRAKYHINRIINLSKLEKYYPAYEVLEIPAINGVLVLQEFHFYPICKFDTPEGIFEFLQLLFIASKNGIFLDFNQNHWLYDKNTHHLIYCDGDYIEDHLPFEKAVKENLNQATIFLNLENAFWFAQAISHFKNKQEENTRFSQFYSLLIEQIKEKHKILRTRQEKNEVIKNRMAAYELIMKELNIT